MTVIERHIKEIEDTIYELNLVGGQGSHPCGKLVLVEIDLVGLVAISFSISLGPRKAAPSPWGTARCRGA